MPTAQFHHLAKEPLADVLHLLERQRASAVIEVETPNGRAEVSIKNGRLLGAAFRDHSGPEALRNVLKLSVGRYQVHFIQQQQLGGGTHNHKTLLHASLPPEESSAEGYSLSEVLHSMSRNAEQGEKPAVRLGTRQVLNSSSSVPPGDGDTQGTRSPSARSRDEATPGFATTGFAPARTVSLGRRNRGSSAPPPGSSDSPESVQSVKYVAQPVRNLRAEEPSPGSTLGGGFVPSPMTGRAGSTGAESESMPPILEPAPVASAPIDTKASFLTTSIHGTAPTVQPSRPSVPPVPGFVQSDWDEEPVPSRRFESETLEELEELNEKIQSSVRHAAPDPLGADFSGRPPSFAPGSTMKSGAEDDEAGPPRVGRYEVLARLRRGGMGSVYLCRVSGSAGFRRLFAMKVLHSDQAGNRDLESFFQEAQVLSKLHHPNIVGIVDVGTTAQPYIVLDYVEGGSLYELCQMSPASRDPKKIVSIVLDALTGIDAAHRATDDEGKPLGLVHCDLTPHNLLVGVDGACRVADFGIATQGSHSDAALRGKPGYVAPERFKGQVGDPRSDLFSLGVVLYVALTGIEPFAGDTPEETMQNVLSKPIPSPSEVGLCPPPSLDWVCMKALARDPDDRFQSAEEMMVHLRKLAAREELLSSQAQVAEWVTAVLGPSLEARRRAAQRVFDSSHNLNSSTPPAQHEAPQQAPPPPPSYARSEKTEYLPALESEGAASSKLSLAGLPKKRKIGLYAAIATTVLVIVLTFFLPEVMGPFFQLEEGTSLDPRVDVNAAQATEDERDKDGSREEQGEQTTTKKAGDGSIQDRLRELEEPIEIPDIE